MNQFGQITQTQFGSGKKTTYGYDEYHLPQSVYSPDIVNREYLFDPATGNLKNRTDNLNLIEETFTYDNLDRLTDIQYNGSAQKTINYYSNGNIDNFTGIGNYTYDDTLHLHAVTEVENTDNSIPSFAYGVEYTSFNSAKLLSDNDGNEYEITYSFDQNRVKTQFINSGNVEKTKYYIGAYEREETSAGTRELNYITTPDGLAAVYEINNSDNEMHYVNTDYLGSIVAVSKQNGYLEQDYYYSAWGQRQILNNNVANTSFILDRGYTGHQHILFPITGGIQGGELINMTRPKGEHGTIILNLIICRNIARMYDPYIGRMLSPDNYVQDISNTQNFNRYSYVLNNPLKYTDPSGDIVTVPFLIASAIIGGTWNIMISAVINPNQTVNQLAGDFAIGAATSFISAGLGGVFFSAGIVKAALISAATNATSRVVGTMTRNILSSNKTFEGVGKAMWQGAIVGALTGTITGYLMAKKYHTNILWGTYQQSFDNIMQTEWGRTLLKNEYNIGEGSDYKVATTRAIRKITIVDYKVNKYKITFEDNDMEGFTVPTALYRNDISTFYFSTMFVTKNTILRYYSDRIGAMAIIGHELIHVHDYAHDPFVIGYKYLGDQAFHAGNNICNYYWKVSEAISEEKAYCYSYGLTGSYFYYRKMVEYSFIEEAFWHEFYEENPF